MPKRPYEAEATRLAREKRRIRASLVKAGMLPGLFEKGGKVLRPEIRTLIDEALAKNAHKD
jgi:hypothetical protein